MSVLELHRETNENDTARVSFSFVGGAATPEQPLVYWL
jgi:hypothetical protein